MAIAKHPWWAFDVDGNDIYDELVTEADRWDWFIKSVQIMMNAVAVSVVQQVQQPMIVRPLCSRGLAKRGYSPTISLRQGNMGSLLYPC